MRSALFLFRLLNVGRMFSRPSRMVLSVLGVAAGVGMFFGVLVLDISITESFRQFSDTLRGSARLELTGPGLNGNWSELKQRLEGVEGVLAVAPILEGAVVVRGRSGAVEAALLGVTPGFAAVAGSLYNSSALELSDNASYLFMTDQGIVVPRQLLHKLGGNKSESLTLECGGRRLQQQISAVLPEQRDSPLSAGLVIIPLRFAQWIFNRPGQVSSFLIVPTADTAESSAAIAARIRGLALRGVEIGSPGSHLPQLEQSTATMRSFSRFISLLALMVGAFLIFNSMAMVVSDRRHEMAVLLALGDRAGTVAGRLLVESALIGLAASLAGVALGSWLGAQLVSRVPAYLEYAYAFKTHLVTPWWAAPVAIFCGIAASVSGAALPCTSVLRWQVASTLRPHAAGELPLGHPSWMLTAGGAACMAAGVISARLHPRSGAVSLALVFCGAIVLLPGTFRTGLAIAEALLLRYPFGRGARFAYLTAASLLESPRRTLATCVAATFSIAAAVAIGGSVDNVLSSAKPFASAFAEYDYYVSASSNPYIAIPLDSMAVGNVSALQGVVEAAEIRGQFLAWRGKRIWLLGQSPAAMRRTSFPFAKGDANSAAAALEGDGIVLSTQIAAAAGIRIGDTVELSTAVGRKNFHVAAVNESWSWPEGTMIIGARAFTNYFQHPEVDQLQVRFAPGTPQLEMLEKLRGAAPGAELVRGETMRDSVTGQLRAQMAAFELIRLLAIAMVALMVLNSTLLSALQRRVETGVLRAIGLSRADVFWMTVLESLTVGAMATVAGLALGWLLQGLAVNTVSAASGLAIHWHTVLRPVLEAGMGGVLAVLLATAYPAWRISRDRVIEMIAYE